MNRAFVSDINHKDCMNHSILDAGLMVYHTPHPLAVIITTPPFPPRHPCHPVLLVETLKHCMINYRPCFLFKTDSLEKYAWIWVLDIRHSYLETNLALSLFRAFLMLMATCSGSALHPESSLASNLVFKYSFTWKEHLVPPALGFWSAHPIGREQKVTDDTPDLALGRFSGRRVVNLATQSRRNWSYTDFWLVLFSCSP